MCTHKHVYRPGSYHIRPHAVPVISVILSFLVTCLSGQQEAQLSAKSHPRVVSVRLLGLSANRYSIPIHSLPGDHRRKSGPAFCFRGRVSLRSPGIFGTHCAGHVGLEPTQIFPASISWLLGLRVCTTTPGVKILNPLRGKSQSTYLTSCEIRQPH